jgi:hypothetical protein
MDSNNADRQIRKTIRENQSFTNYNLKHIKFSNIKHERCRGMINYFEIDTQQWNNDNNSRFKKENKIIR